MRRVVVTFGPCWAELRGYGSRELLTDLGARLHWLPRRRCWSTTPETASAATSLAEERGWQVEVVEAEPEPLSPPSYRRRGRMLAAMVTELEQARAALGDVERWSRGD